jgi:hypothetical protein
MRVSADIDVLPHQLEFIKSENKFTALVGGFGSGKSYAGILRTMELIKKRKGKALIIFVSPTYTLANDVNIPGFTEFLDHYLIPYKIRQSERKITLTGYLKGQVWFRSGDSPEKIVGVNATDFILDEFDILTPKQQRILWDKVIARIRGCDDSTGAITTTPEGFKKTYELFVEKQIGKLIKANTAANVYLPSDYVDTLYSQYDSKLVQQYVNGEFVNIKGALAYYSFDRNRNVITYEDLDPHEIEFGIDFNVNPMTSAHAIFTGGKIIFIGESYLRNSNTESMTVHLKNRYPGKVFRACPDMTGKKRTTNSSLGQSDLTILRSAGFAIDGTRNPFVRDRLNSVNSALEKGKILIMDNCKYLIRDFEQVILNEYGEIDKSNLDLTHISDAAGYLIYKYFPLKDRIKWGN